MQLFLSQRKRLSQISGKRWSKLKIISAYSSYLCTFERRQDPVPIKVRAAHNLDQIRKSKRVRCVLFGRTEKKESKNARPARCTGRVGRRGSQSRARCSGRGAAESSRLAEPQKLAR